MEEARDDILNEDDNDEDLRRALATSKAATHSIKRRRSSTPVDERRMLAECVKLDPLRTR